MGRQFLPFVLIATDGRTHLHSRQTYRWIAGKNLQGGKQRGCRGSVVIMELVECPQDSTNLYRLLFSECTQLAVTGEQNAAWTVLGQDEGERVMHGELRRAASDDLRAQHALSGQIGYVQSPGEQLLLFGISEAKKLPNNNLNIKRLVAMRLSLETACTAPATRSSYFLTGPKQLFVEHRSGDQEFVGKGEECVKERHLPQVDEATGVANDDPHRRAVALSTPVQPPLSAA